MKKIFIILIFFSIKISAQKELVFNKKFIDSEDKWVVFQKDKEGKFNFGFIYIDEQAGLTLNFEGSFKISNEGFYIVKKSNNSSLKVRLKNNNIKVAWLPNNKFSELKIPDTPEWLKFYKTNLNSTQRLYRWGFLYNGWGKCTKALTFLEKAYKQKPKFKNLGVELAYSYNCLKKFDKALLIMQNVVKLNPKDSYSYKELIYAQLKSGKLKEASKSVERAIKTTNGQYNGENTYNLLVSYYQIKDVKNSLKWIKKAKKWNLKNKQLLNSIAIIEKEMTK